MGDFERFIVDNAEADTSKLLLSCRTWPVPDDPNLLGLDRRELAVSTIESRKKLRKKVPEWYATTSLVYPNPLSAEQCSSSFTASYKASLASRITGGRGRLADLTGGLGVDSHVFSKIMDEVLYNDMNEALAKAAVHNFKELGAGNITVKSLEVTDSSIDRILRGFKPDILFLDPARRSPDGRKVFMMDDCSPDVVKLLPDLFSCCRHLLLKLSPMADISQVTETLNRSYESHLEKTEWRGWNGNWVREIHVISSGGECKELLVWLDREWSGPYMVICREDEAELSFSSEELSGVKSVLPDSVNAEILFEPGRSFTKAGAFNALCGRLGLVKLAKSTHLYTCPATMSKQEMTAGLERLRPFGKVFEVLEILPMSKASFREIRNKYPRCEVSARNIPLSSDELRSRLGVASGDDAHIFGVRIETPFENGNFLMVCRRI